MPNDIHDEIEKMLPSHKGRRARLDKVAPPLKDLVQAARRDLNDGVERYLAGEDVDLPALAVDVVDAKREAEAQQELRAVLTSAKLILEGDSGRVTVQQTVPAINFLRGELGSLVSRVRSLDVALGATRTAQEAITNGKSDQWAQLDKAVRRYDQIRAEQYKIYCRVHGANSAALKGQLERSGLLADALLAEPYFVNRRWHSARNSPTSYTQDQIWVRWLRSAQLAPTISAVDGWWPSDGRHGYLRTICTTAHPWLPDLETLEQVDRAALDASSEALGNGVTDYKWEARDTYATLTGADLAPRDSFAEELVR